MTRGHVLAAILAVSVLAVVAGLLLAAPSWFWHPLGMCTGGPIAVRDCKGYNAWSGSFSDIGEITILGGLITATVAAWRLKKAYECHAETCRKLGVHHVEGTPYRACWHHHPVLGKHPRGRVPLVHIHAEHRKANGLP